MPAAGAERSADSREENRPICPRSLCLPLGRREAGITVLELLRTDECQRIGQLPRQARNVVRGGRFRLFENFIYGFHGFHQESGGAVFAADYFFPVPLIDIEGMQVIRHLVPPDRVHIGIKTGSGLHTVTSQGEPLPLGQRMDDFSRPAAFIEHIERYRPFRPVQIVVESGFRPDKQRCGHPS